MHFSLFPASGLVSGLLFATSAVAAPPLLQPIEVRQDDCGTASNRACWADGFDINTDYDLETPEGSLKTVSVTMVVDVSMDMTLNIRLSLVHLDDHRAHQLGGPRRRCQGNGYAYRRPDARSGPRGRLGRHDRGDHR